MDQATEKLVKMGFTKKSSTKVNTLDGIKKEKDSEEIITMELDELLSNVGKGTSFSVVDKN